MESLQQSKLYQKEQKRQFKELKELVRRHQKKTSELLREINNKYKKTARQCSKSRYVKNSRFICRILEVKMSYSGFMSASKCHPVSWGVYWCVSIDISIRSSGSSSEKDERLQQLRDEQQQQLLALRQEQYYSQKYLQREHIKMVKIKRASSSSLFPTVIPFCWRLFLFGGMRHFSGELNFCAAV